MPEASGISDLSPIKLKASQPKPNRVALPAEVTHGHFSDLEDFTDSGDETSDDDGDGGKNSGTISKKPLTKAQKKRFDFFTVIIFGQMFVLQWSEVVPSLVYSVS